MQALSQAPRVALVAASFNAFVVDRMLEAAVAALRGAGLPEQNTPISRVPGAVELPLACQRWAALERTHAVVALGCVIRGETPHFDYVCEAAAQGCTRVALDAGKPVIFGVLTTDTVEQAMRRAGVGGSNKGHDAAVAALEMLKVLRQIEFDD